jgi:hypothetical protein
VREEAVVEGGRHGGRDIALLPLREKVAGASPTDEGSTALSVAMGVNASF